MKSYWLSGLTLATLLCALGWVLLQQRENENDAVPALTVRQGHHPAQRTQELITQPWKPYVKPDAAPSWDGIPEARLRQVREHIHARVIAEAPALGFTPELERDLLHGPHDSGTHLAINGVVELVLQDITAGDYSLEDLRGAAPEVFDAVVVQRLRQLARGFAADGEPAAAQ